MKLFQIFWFEYLYLILLWVRKTKDISLLYNTGIV